jgi:hypothetical protein
MDGNRKIGLIAVVAMTALAAQITLGGTQSFGAAGSKRRVAAQVETTTLAVSSPIVERKVEGTETWVVDSQESVSAEIDMVLEEPFKPILEIATALTTTDCNDNGTPDGTEISNGATDADGDGILDSCEYAIGDLNLNGVVDSQDVSILLGWWGLPNPVYGDLTGDGVVDARDLGVMLGRFGAIVW